MRFIHCRSPYEIPRVVRCSGCKTVLFNCRSPYEILTSRKGSSREKTSTYCRSPYEIPIMDKFKPAWWSSRIAVLLMRFEGRSVIAVGVMLQYCRSPYEILEYL